jgi:hypothetical protein
VSVERPAALDAALDAELLCYCTDLTFGALRAACAQGGWPLPGKERSGRLCTGCQGDLLHCLRLLGMRTPA